MLKEGKCELKSLQMHVTAVTDDPVLHAGDNLNIQEWHTSIIAKRQYTEGTLYQYFGEFYNACFGFAKQIEQNSCILFVVWETM